MKHDGVPWRLAEQIVRMGREAAPRFRRAQPLAEQWAALDRDAPGWKVAALRIALRGGAYDLAAHLAEDLLEVAGARTLVAEAFHAVGDPRAAAFAPARPDPASLARRAEEQPLALLRDPQLHIALYTVYRRSDPERALAALNRFLRAYALPRCAIAGDSGHLLADLRFERPRRVGSGPLVSVVMAARNAASTIHYAVDSILGQSWRSLELLVCDDASEDDTLDRLREVQRRDRRVRVFRSAAPQGPYNVRNALLAEARGELVTFHDADDLALPGRLQAQLRRLERGWVASYVTLVRATADGRFVFFHGGSAMRPAMVSLMIRRERLGRFRPAWYGADLEMRELLRARHGDRAVDVLRQPHVFALLAENSLTRREGSESLEDGFRSASRRAYAELVFRRYVAGDATDADIERMLHETGNWVDGAPVARVRG
jgi:hypothetical protein